MSKQSSVIIVGAGPAGLTAALELLKTTKFKPIIYEASDDIGGISKTVNYQGNRIDIGGHRFFSKSDVVLNWWDHVMPTQNSSLDPTIQLTYQGKTRTIRPHTQDATVDTADNIMLVRQRHSRIYHAGKFFDYPLTIDQHTLRNLGLRRIMQAGASYTKAQIAPRQPEKTLEDFFINRFGQHLYETFFKDYTEKVWGVPCEQMSAEWGMQRIKSLNVQKVITHALTKPFRRLGQPSRKTETSLIEQFLYPKYGPGQLWERVADMIREQGGEIHMRTSVTKWTNRQNQLRSVAVCNHDSGAITEHEADYFISSVAVKNLVGSLQGDPVPESVKKVAAGLEYRDFITVGILLRKSETPSKLMPDGDLVADNWIYIQEPGFQVGRIQIFNNWSPHLVKDPDTIWVGLEYFVREGDHFWSLSDEAIKKLAIAELTKLQFSSAPDVLDSTVIRIKKAYPGYFGTYHQFDLIRQHLDKIENLFLVGRNGMHRYNNQDHSMLTAMQAVKNIAAGTTTKDNIWSINTDDEYHEARNPSSRV